MCTWHISWQVYISGTSISVSRMFPKLNLTCGSPDKAPGKCTYLEPPSLFPECSKASHMCTWHNSWQVYISGTSISVPRMFPKLNLTCVPDKAPVKWTYLEPPSLFPECSQSWPRRSYQTQTHSSRLLDILALWDLNIKSFRILKYALFKTIFSVQRLNQRRSIYRSAYLAWGVPSIGGCVPWTASFQKRLERVYKPESCKNRMLTPSCHVWFWSRLLVLYIYYTTAAGNAISSQLLSGQMVRSGKSVSTDRPSQCKSHLPGHSPQLSWGGRRVGPALHDNASSLVQTLYATAKNLSRRDSRVLALLTMRGTRVGWVQMMTRS